MTVRKWLGLALQLLGTLLAATALFFDWREHGRGQHLVPVLHQGVVWVKRHLLRRPCRRCMGHAHGDIVLLGDAVNARLIPGGDAPIPEQIEYLRREVDSLHAAVEAARQAAAQAEARLTGRVDGVEARGIETTRELDDRLTAVATGSVRLELVGLVLVGIGSVLSVG